MTVRAALLLFGCVPFVPVVAIGCFDRLDADPQFDAGHFDAPTFDAVIFPDGALPDVVLPDSSPDVDAGPLPVKVIVLRNGAPEANVNVVFQDATGAVLEAKTTAIDGSASRVVTAGAMVTVVLGSVVSSQLVTVVGVKPGDVLTAIDDTGTIDAVAVDLPLATPPQGTVYYAAQTGRCGSFLNQAGPLRYSVAPECKRAGKFPVLVFAQDINQASIGYSFKKGNTVTAPDGGTTPITGLPAWATAGSVQLTATNAGTAAVDLGYAEIADGIGYAVGRSVMPMGGTASHTFDTYGGFADAAQYEVTRIGALVGPYDPVVSIVKRASAPAAPQSIDLSQALPAMTMLTSDTTNGARPKVTIALAGAPTGADALLVSMSWFGLNPEAGMTSGRWLIVAPPSTTTVTAPELPTALAALGPSLEMSFDAPSAAIFDSDQVPGYDQLRAGFAVLPRPETIQASAAGIPTLPSNGTLRVSAMVLAPM